MFKTKEKKKTSVEDVFHAFSVPESNTELIKCLADLEDVKSELDSCKAKQEPVKLVSELLKHPKFVQRQKGSGIFRSKSKKLDKKDGSIEDVFSAISVQEVQCKDELEKSNIALKETTNQLEKSNVQLQEYKKQLDESEKIDEMMSETINRLQNENETLRNQIDEEEKSREDLLFTSDVYGLDWDSVMKLTDSYDKAIQNLQEDNSMLHSIIKKLVDEVSLLKSAKKE